MFDLDKVHITITM